MRTIVTLDISIDAGVSINEAAVEAARLARLMWVTIHFDFNGVKCHIGPNGNPSELAKSYMRILRNDDKHKMCFEY